MLIFLGSCTGKKNEVAVAPDPCRAISFAGDIQPIINTRCAIQGCHVAGFPQGNFTVYDSLKIKVDHGKFQLRVMETKSMPPLNPLSTADLDKIQCWLEQGAPDN